MVQNTELSFNFGKHKNKNISEVPHDYLRWVYKENETKEKLSPYMKKILEYIKTNVDVADKPFHLTTMPFGKYKDEILEDVPQEYLDWIYKQNEGKEGLSKYMIKLLDYIASGASPSVA